MARIDTSDWKEFVVGDLFPRFVKPEVLHSRQVIEVDEGIPYIVRTKFGNGVKCRVHPVEDVEPSPAGVITWGAENATFFYQEEPFLSGRDIYYIDTREYSPMICMFLSSCLQTVTHKYPYNFGLFPDLLKEERIKLPVDANNDPDWVYMDDYMSEVMRESEASLENLRQADGDRHAVDIAGWKEFTVGELFDIHPTSAYKMTNAQLMDDGDNPVVVNSSYSNGVGGYTSLETTERGNLVTFSDTTTAEAVFYQPDAFVGYPHVQGMYPKGEYAAMWGELHLLFFVTVFKQSAKLQGFDYAFKFTREIAAGMKVPLPVDADGHPDWKYMENYMSEVMQTSEGILPDLSDVGGGGRA